MDATDRLVPSSVELVTKNGFLISDITDDLVANCSDNILDFDSFLKPVINIYGYHLITKPSKELFIAKR